MSFREAEDRKVHLYTLAMPPKLTLDQLKPFKSVFVARLHDGSERTARQVLLKLRKVLKVKQGDASRPVIAVGNESEPVEASFVHYEVRRPVAWSTEPVMDRVNHLALVIKADNWLAIHITETSKKGSIKRALRSGDLGPLRFATPGELKAAFVKGRARTLWLRGTHPSTEVKADAKVMSGRDLESALDPLADQSYRYTAIRAEPENATIGEVMGLAVDESRIWVSPSSDRRDFEASIGAALEAIAANEGASLEPLPVLAIPQNDLNGVEDAYEIAITPPELLIAGPVLDSSEADALAVMEKLAFATSFDVTASHGTSLSATVRQSGQVLGQIDLAFTAVGDEIESSLSGTADPAHVPVFSEMMGSLRNPESVTVNFESGHSIQDRQVFSMRYRDLPFSGWKWVALDGAWEVDREKPAAGVHSLGSGDRSLFSWIFDQWPIGAGLAGARGWLACDDRPGETADFVHLDLSQGAPTLTLIHAKGAHSSSANREIAVAPYETVCAQAVKNLRHLDSTLAAGNLLASRFPEALNLLAWEDGEVRHRQQFIEQLNLVGANARRRVVIVQPHVRESLVAEVRNDSTHFQQARMRRLDTLLSGVSANCQSVGSEFLVVGAA
jgi:hypothetical protein